MVNKIGSHNIIPVQLEADIAVTRGVIHSLVAVIFSLLAWLFRFAKAAENLPKAIALQPKTEEIEDFCAYVGKRTKGGMIEEQGLSLHSAFKKDCDRMKAELYVEGVSFEEMFKDDVTELERLSKERGVLDSESPEYAELDRQFVEKHEALHQKIMDAFVRILKEKLGSSTHLSAPISALFCQNGPILLRDVLDVLSNQHYGGSLYPSALCQPSSSLYLTFPNDGVTAAKIEIAMSGQYSKLFREDGMVDLAKDAHFTGLKIFSIGLDGKTTVETQALLSSQ